MNPCPQEVRAVKFVLNSDVVVTESPALLAASELLRSLGVFSVRETCGVGVCGTCTINVDGVAVSACLTPVFRLDGTSVVTSEGLGGPKGELHPIHEAFLAEQAFQCSFCTPGFVLATHALLSDVASPNESDIEDYLSGHICRCGSYANIRNAVLRASRLRHLSDQA
jgi:aerobic-type carbon monoxide dehydrogenase small subunit (CoxS/CutS family)